MPVSTQLVRDGIVLSRDEQHKLLAGLGADLADLLRGPVSPEDFIRDSGAFRALLARHFAAEALELHAADPAGYDEHVGHHKAILERLDQAIEEANSRRSVPSMYDVIEVIESCLYEHDLAYDGGSAVWTDVTAR